MSIGWRRAGQRCRRRRNAGADGSTVDTVTFLKRRYRHRHAIGLFDLVAGFQFVGDRRRTPAARSSPSRRPRRPRSWPGGMERGTAT